MAGVPGGPKVMGGKEALNRARERTKLTPPSVENTATSEDTDVRNNVER
jgi:hypothetical protein